MEYKIEIRELEPLRVAYMRYEGDVTKANRVFPKVFQAIRGKTNGAPFFQLSVYAAGYKAGSAGALCSYRGAAMQSGHRDTSDAPFQSGMCYPHRLLCNAVACLCRD